MSTLWTFVHLHIVKIGTKVHIVDIYVIVRVSLKQTLLGQNKQKESKNTEWRLLRTSAIPFQKRFKEKCK